MRSRILAVTRITTANGINVFRKTIVRLPGVCCPRYMATVRALSRQTFIPKNHYALLRAQSLPIFYLSRTEHGVILLLFRQAEAEAGRGGVATTIGHGGDWGFAELPPPVPA